MKEEQDKKIRAAIAGAMMLVKQEEENRSAVSPQIIQSSVWADHGRQTIMMNRNLMQRRVIGRIK